MTIDDCFLLKNNFFKHILINQSNFFKAANSSNSLSTRSG